MNLIPVLSRDRIESYVSHIDFLSNHDFQLKNFSDLFTKDIRSNELRNVTYLRRVKSILGFLWFLVSAVGTLRHFQTRRFNPVDFSAPVLICLDGWSPWSGVSADFRDHIWGDLAEQIKGSYLVLTDGDSRCAGFSGQGVFFNVSGILRMADVAMFLRCVFYDVALATRLGVIWEYLPYVRASFFNYKCFLTIKRCISAPQILFHGEFNAHGRTVVAASRELGIESIAVAHSIYFPLFLQYWLTDSYVKNLLLPDQLWVQCAYNRSLIRRSSAAALERKLKISVVGNFRQRSPGQPLGTGSTRIGVVLCSWEATNFFNLGGLEKIASLRVRGHPSKNMLNGKPSYVTDDEGTLIDFFSRCDLIVVGTSNAVLDALLWGKTVVRLRALVVEGFYPIEGVKMVDISELIDFDNSKVSASDYFGLVPNLADYYTEFDTVAAMKLLGNFGDSQ